MEIFTRVIGLKERNMAKENIFLLKDLFMREVGKRTLRMGLDPCSILMVIPTKVNGSMVRDQDMEHTDIKIAISMKGIIFIFNLTFINVR